MFVTGNQSEKTSSLWKNKAAIAFLIFGGLQSVLFYTEVTWLPTISQSIGFSKAEAGLMSGIYNLAAIPMSSIITTLLSRQTKESRRNIMLLISLITLVGWQLFEEKLNMPTIFGIDLIFIGVMVINTFSAAKI